MFASRLATESGNYERNGVGDRSTWPNILEFMRSIFPILNGASVK